MTNLYARLRASFDSGISVRALRLGLETAPGLTAAALSIVVAQAAAPVAFMVVSGRLLGAIVPALHQSLGSAAVGGLLLIVAVLGALFVVEQVLPQLRWALTGALGRRVQTAIEQRVMAAAAVPPGIGHLEDPEVKDGLAMAVGQIGWLGPQTSLGNLASRISLHLLTLGSIALLATWRWYVALVLLVAVEWMDRETGKAFIKLTEVQQGQSGAMRRTQYFNDLALKPEAAKEVRVFGLTSWIDGRYAREWGAAMKVVWASRAEGRRSLMLSTGGVALVCVLVLALIGRDAAAGALGLGGIAVMAQAVVGALTTVSNVEAATSKIFLSYSAQAIKALSEVERAMARLRADLAGSRPAVSRPVLEIRFE